MRRYGWAALALLLSGGVAWAELPSREFTTQTKTASSSKGVTDQVIWTPASGKRIVLQGALFCASNATDNIELESSNVDVIPPFAIESYGCKTFSAGGAALWMGATDATLTYTGGVRGPGTLSVMVWGYEIQ